jgi:predicted porin
MQKKLLTMAVAGALAAPGLAFAQASGTEVYGTINMAFGNFKYGDGSTTRDAPGISTATPQGASVSKWDVANGASNYGVRSRESLGGGLSAWIQIEQNAPLERSSNPAIKPASRNSAVGIQGGFGNVFLGQWTTPWADLDALWGIGTVGFWGPVTSIIGRREATGTAPNFNCQGGEGVGPGGVPSTPGKSVCDALPAGGGVGHAFWRRTSQSIFYQSNVMAGVQAKLSYQTNEGKTNGNPAGTNGNASMWSGSVQWAGMGGRARVGAAIDRHKDFTTVGSTDSGYSVKGGFNAGVVDIGLAYEHMTYKCGFQPFASTTQPVGQNLGTGCFGVGDVKAKQYGVAFAVPVGPGSIRGSFSKASDLTGGGMQNSTGVAQGGGLVPNGSGISATGASQWNLGYEHRFSKRTNIGVGYAKIHNKTNAQFTWTGAPPNQAQNPTSSTSTAGNTPLFNSDVSTFFVSMTHRF